MNGFVCRSVSRICSYIFPFVPKTVKWFNDVLSWANYKKLNLEWRIKVPKIWRCIVHALCYNLMLHSNFWANQSKRSQSWVGFVEDEVEVGAFKLPIPESKVSHWVVTETALPILLLKGLEFLAFSESNVSTKFCTRRTCSRVKKQLFRPSKINMNNAIVDDYHNEKSTTMHNT